MADISDVKEAEIKDLYQSLEDLSGTCISTTLYPLAGLGTLLCKRTLFANVVASSPYPHQGAVLKRASQASAVNNRRTGTNGKAHGGMEEVFISRTVGFRGGGSFGFLMHSPCSSQRRRGVFTSIQHGVFQQSKKLPRIFVGVFIRLASGGKGSEKG